MIYTNINLTRYASNIVRSHLAPRPGRPAQPGATIFARRHCSAAPPLVRVSDASRGRSSFGVVPAWRATLVWKIISAYRGRSSFGVVPARRVSHMWMINCCCCEAAP